MIFSSPSGDGGKPLAHYDASATKGVTFRAALGNPQAAQLITLQMNVDGSQWDYTKDIIVSGTTWQQITVLWTDLQAAGGAPPFAPAALNQIVFPFIASATVDLYLDDGAVVPEGRRPAPELLRLGRSRRRGRGHGGRVVGGFALRLGQAGAPATGRRSVGPPAQQISIDGHRLGPALGGVEPIGVMRQRRVRRRPGVVVCGRRGLSRRGGARGGGGALRRDRRLGAAARAVAEGARARDRAAGDGAEARAQPRRPEGPGDAAVQAAAEHAARSLDGRLRRG